MNPNTIMKKGKKAKRQKDILLTCFSIFFFNLDYFPEIDLNKE